MAAAAAAAAAQAQALAAQQAIAQGMAAQNAILTQLMNQQIALRDHVSNPSSARKLDECPDGGTAAFNPWALEFKAYYAARHYDWTLTMSDAEMTAHHHYPPDPPAVLVGAALQQAQEEVEALRRKAQEAVYLSLIHI